MSIIEITLVALVAVQMLQLLLGVLTYRTDIVRHQGYKEEDDQKRALIERTVRAQEAAVVTVGGELGPDLEVAGDVVLIESQKPEGP